MGKHILSSILGEGSSWELPPFAEEPQMSDEEVLKPSGVQVEREGDISGSLAIELIPRLNPDP
jgi:hypothetical protein